MIAASANQPCHECGATDGRVLVAIGNARAWANGATLGCAEIFARFCHYDTPGYARTPSITPGYFCQACWRVAVEWFDAYERETSPAGPFPALQRQRDTRRERVVAWDLC
jgi:hypothetical protein